MPVTNFLCLSCNPKEPCSRENGLCAASMVGYVGLLATIVVSVLVVVYNSGGGSEAFKAGMEEFVKVGSVTMENEATETSVAVMPWLIMIPAGLALFGAGSAFCVNDKCSAAAICKVTGLVVSLALVLLAPTIDFVIPDNVLGVISGCAAPAVGGILGTYVFYCKKPVEDAEETKNEGKQTHEDDTQPGEQDDEARESISPANPGDAEETMTLSSQKEFVEAKYEAFVDNDGNTFYMVPGLQKTSTKTKPNDTYKIMISDRQKIRMYQDALPPQKRQEITGGGHDKRRRLASLHKLLDAMET